MDGKTNEMTNLKNGRFLAREFVYAERFLYDYDSILWQDAKWKLLGTFLAMN